MSRVERLHREKVTRYSIRKVSFGAASVAVAALFMFLGNGAVAAAELSVTPDTSGKEILNLPSEAETLNKEALTNLIEEIEGKFAKGIYASKTEDSVNQLKTALDEAKSVLNNAKTQEELTRAYNKLVTVTTQLKTKPEEKKEAPAVDTTNGKATVSKVATNTEKSSESNSIANSGSRDERNGKEINKANAFRTDAATTDTDPAANQTYTAPTADADLNTLVKALLALDPTVENNSKLSQNMDSLGDSKEVAKGTVKEITEFGGWTAVDGGVFAIARRTEEGVYPLETINSTLDDTVWLQEQAFDRDTEYTLLLSKSRTRSNRDEVVYDNSVYKPTGEGGGITKNLARYKGIEKTFTAYSTKEGSDVIVKFKPGYVGDSEGKKARYKVEVYSIEGTTETKIYETTFDPSKNINDAKQIVTAAKDGTNRAKIKISDSSNSTTIDSGVDHTVRKNFIGKREAEKLMAQPGNKPNGTAGTFTSKPIALPQGADHYKVRVSLADQDKTGMSYQAWDDKYSVPVTGADFSIAQDTSNVARNLLQRIYDKLKATESADKNGKTSQTIQDYEAELEKVKTLLANPAARTPNFKQALQDLLAKQSGLKTDKTGLTNSKAELDALVNEDPTPGKTTDTAKAYNAAKEAAKTEIAAALTVINDENATPEQVSAALEKVNAKKTALQQAKDGLIEAATAEEKAKLKEDADSLVKADTTGKTPKSIEAYNTKYEAIKAQLEAAKTEAAAVLVKENNASKAEAKAAQAKVDAAKAELTKAAELLVNKADKTELTQAKEALSTLTTETDPTTGKTADSAKAYNDAKTAAQEAIKEAETVIADENATPEQVTAALNKVNEKKTALQQAKDGLIEAATAEEKAKLKEDADLLTKADETGKTPDSIAAYERKYEELKAQLEAAKAEADKVLAKGNNATKEEVKVAQAKVDAVKTELETAKNLLVEAATTEEKTKLKTDSDALKKADTTGKTADSIKAYEAEFEKLKAQLEEAKAEADKVLAKGNNATKEEVKAAQAKVDAAKTALDKAAESLKDLDRDAAKKEIADAAKKATDAIEASTSLTPEQKADEKAKVAKEATDATDAIDNATTEEGINSAKENGKLAIEKEAAITAISAEKAAKEQEIDNNTKLSDEEKAAAKAEVAKAAIEAVEAIQKADTQDAVDAAKAKGEAAIKAVNPVGKEKALDAIQKAAEEKIAEIDKNDKLSADEKAAAKAEVAKAAIEAVEAIQKADTQDAVEAAKTKGETAIKSVNPVGKEKALDAIQKVAEEKIAEIDKNDKLSADEKAAAKAEVAKVAIEAVEAIQKAETQEAVNAAQTKGETAIKSVNPVGKEKALEAIKATRDAKLAEIAKATGLSAEEKAAAKAEVAKAAIEAVEAIQKAATQEAINAAQAKGEAAIKAVNSIGKEAVNEAKAAVEAAAAEKIASIKANPNLSAEEKAKAIAEVERLKQAALNAIDKATTKAELDKALRTFLYQLDLESLVYDRPTFDLEAYIQASITGVVKVERGKAITQADIITKLSLPENVTVISIDLPDTNTLGDKFAKVMLRLPDGTEVTVKVPVRVVASQNGDSKPETALPDYGRNNGSTNTEATVDKAKLEGAIRQLDELIIQESAKLDAETAQEATALLAEVKAVFANAKASQAEVDAMVKRIEDFMAKVASSTNHATPANDQATQTSAVAPATAQSANASQTASAQTNTRTVAKELPNTGTADSTVAMVAATASALLGLGLAGRRRKEDEEA
ncbi:matrix-binding protein [Streptococcus mitis]|nr:matrix-binding protein [Streptococcus mitis]